MPTDVIQDKQQVHELIDRLAPSQLVAVRGLLEAMLDPVARAIANAPAAAEPVTEEEKRALVEAPLRPRQNSAAGPPRQSLPSCCTKSRMSKRLMARSGK